jgi:hypothetical protein
MATALLRLPSRLALFVCGMISILLSKAFRATQYVMPDANVKWSLFSITLGLVGCLTVVIALLPGSWIEKACKSGPDREDQSSLPIKLFGALAGFAYLVSVGLDFAPLSWHLTARMLYFVCPACVLTITVDPSLAAIMLVLAPVNAAVYGSLGALTGYLFLAVRNRI